MSKELFDRLEDLVKFVQQGKAFTEDVMKENERLRLKLVQLETRNRDLTSNLSSARKDALVEESNALHEKIKFLESRFQEVEQENKDFAQSYVEIQSLNDKLLNLYISSYQLHSTLNPDEVVGVIEEIILNLIGAEEYFICLQESARNDVVLVAAEGLAETRRSAILTGEDSILKNVLNSGKPYFRGKGDRDSWHMACVPMKVKNDIVGALSIIRLLDQKHQEFTPLDYELLNMLADHAAIALVSANLYSRTERKLRTMENFMELLKQDASKQTAT